MHAARLVADGALEALVARLPPVPSEARPHAHPRRALPPWRADEVSVHEAREEMRLQALAALRQLLTSCGAHPSPAAAAAAARMEGAGGGRALVAHLLAGEKGLIAPVAAGEAALGLDALVEHSRACELEVFRLGASAPLAEAVAGVLRTGGGGGARPQQRASDPRRMAASPWAAEQAEPHEEM